jgi:predicted secreted protein
MAGLDAYGTTFSRGDGADPEVFTAVAHITEIGGPEESRETYDVTAHDSPNQWRQFIGGLKDGGEVSLELNFFPEDHQVLRGDIDDEEPRSYRIVWPDTSSTTVTFSAVFTGMSPAAPHDDKLTASATYKVSGEPVWS